MNPPTNDELDHFDELQKVINDLRREHYEAYLDQGYPESYAYQLMLQTVKEFIRSCWLEVPD